MFHRCYFFDFVKILSLDDIYFSNGNVGVSSPEIYNDINFLPNLEWNYIYHRNSLFGFLPESVRHIVYCRNAEVLIKNEINVGYFSGFHHSEGVFLLTSDKAYLLVDFRYFEAAQKFAVGCEVICFKPEMVLI